MNSVLSVFTAVQGASAPWFAGLCRELYTFFTYIRQVLWFCIRVAAVIQGGPWSSGTVRASVHFNSVTESTVLITILYTGTSTSMWTRNLLV